MFELSADVDRLERYADIIVLKRSGTTIALAFQQRSTRLPVHVIYNLGTVRIATFERHDLEAMPGERKALQHFELATFHVEADVGDRLRRVDLPKERIE